MSVEKAIQGRTNGDANSSPGEVPLIVIFTAVIWVTAAIVGGVGLLQFQLEHRNKAAATASPAVAISTPMLIELTPQAETEQPSVPAADANSELAESDAPTQAVVIPTPAISFAIATDGPAHLSTLEAAGFAGQPKPISQDLHLQKGSRHAQTLTLGVGFAANQPAPVYPRNAELEGQQGNVILRLTVDDAGHVTDAKLVQACPWPLLNEEAMNTVLQKWRLPGGHAGTYILPITFRLNDDSGAR